MLNLRYIFRLTAAFVTRFRALIGISVGVGIATFFILRYLLPFFSGKSVEKIGITGRFNTINMPSVITEMIGDGLTKLDKSGNVEPNLAKSWETPDKGKTWIFTLRDGLIWQDGKKVTSQTISYQFSDVTVEHPNDNQIVFKLQNPYSAFPAVVSHPTFKKGLLGTGAWEVKNIVLSGSNVEQVLLQEKQTGIRKIFKFYPTEDRTKLAFELGEVDTLKDILNPAPLDSWKKIKIERIVNKGEYVAVFFNSQDKLLAEKNLRQALSYAIDKEVLAGERALGPISANSWAFNPLVKPYSFDFEKAKGIVDDYKKESKLENLEVNLSAPPLLLPQAEKVAKNWSDLGIKVNLQVTAGVPSEYQAFMAIFDIPDDPDQYSIWHSTQTTTNLTNYQNPRIDKLLEDGRSEINLEDRKRIYLDFQRFLVEDSPAAFLYYPETFTISRR